MQGHRRPHPTLNGDLSNLNVHTARSRRARPSPCPSPTGTPDSIVEVYFQNEADNGSPAQHLHRFPSSVASGLSPSVARSMSPRPSYFANSEPKGVPPPPYSATAFTHKPNSTAAPPQKDSTGLGLHWRSVSQDLGSKRRRPPTHKSWFDNTNVIKLVIVVFLLACAYIFVLPSGKKTELQKKMRPSALATAPVLAPLLNAATRKKQPSFREHLQADVNYLISPNHGDLALQAMNLYHLTHLAATVSRSVIATPFNLPASSAVGPATLPLSSIFDLQRFRKLTNVDVVDYDDIRPHNADLVENLGCWIGVASQTEIEERSKAMIENGLAASFFPMNIMGSVSAGPGQGDTLIKAHTFLASFEKDASAQSGLVQQALYSQQVTTALSSKHTAPDAHVMCIDHTLYRPEHPTTAQSTNHLDPKDHTAFYTHGRALHFAAELQETGLDIASFVLGHRGPYIAVHISAAAQKAECQLRQLPSECEPVISKFVEAVEQVRNLAMVSFKSGKNREHRHSTKSLSVLVSTDVADLGFRGELASLGWTLLEYDDLELVQRFGSWSPEIMDGIIQSSAKAFVGTRGSAKSTLAALRIEAWRQGPSVLVS